MLYTKKSIEKQVLKIVTKTYRLEARIAIEHVNANQHNVQMHSMQVNERRQILVLSQRYLAICVIICTVVTVLFIVIVMVVNACLTLFIKTRLEFRTMI